MSKIRPGRADVREVFDGFGGIGENGLSTKKATDMRNFRLLSNGSLEKRCGWEVRNRFAGEVRAVWQGVIDGSGCIFVVVDESVYRFVGETQALVGTLTETGGQIDFAYYLDRLYLFDENEIYVYSEALKKFDVAYGYAPLFGVNWHPTDQGETNEPLNLFSKRLRVNYLNTEGHTSFVLPYYASSIDCVRVDNVRVSDYGFTKGSNIVTLSTAGSYVEIAFTMSTSLQAYLNLRQCTRACVERFGARELLMTYDNREGREVFCSSRVDHNMLNYCKVAYSDVDPLYVKWDGAIAVGDPLHPITTICRQHDRMLVFSALGATAVIPDEESDALESYALLRGFGCTAPIDLRLDGDAVILNESGVFRLRSGARDTDELEPIALSAGMEHMLTDSFLKNAVATSDRLHGELWLRDTTDEEGLVWVYQIARGQWYCFDNILADRFLLLDGETCFISSQSICRFDEALDSDGGRIIESRWESSVLGFSVPEALKRTLRMSLCADQGGNVTVITLATERREKRLTIQNLSKASPHLIDLRVPVGRFRLLRVCIRDVGMNRSRYDRLAFYANS